LGPSTCEKTYESENKSLPDTKSAGNLTLELPASRTIKQRLLLFISNWFMIFCYSSPNELKAPLELSNSGTKKKKRKKERKDFGGNGFMKSKYSLGRKSSLMVHHSTQTTDKATAEI
jgi:hypothetical protein